MGGFPNYPGKNRGPKHRMQPAVMVPFKETNNPVWRNVQLSCQRGIKRNIEFENVGAQGNHEVASVERKRGKQRGE